eukprot:TRINITY_DN42390_c0_g1_i1.p1 TRINITY_DN42390_c0_g1~~TRINITY_DN42390_c0_g1_i1.p1  ORF type:complete len:131 (-),score=22.03 TRINITY_DN42390_c0_g1_i1:117-509(-)
MAVMSESSSFLVASLCSLLTISSMQVFKTFLASSQMYTILGGFVGSVLFLFLLTAIGNLEKVVFGANFQTQLKEVTFCLLVSMGAAASIHRVCATVCLLFSVVMLYSVYKISQDTYSASSSVSTVIKKKK